MLVDSLVRKCAVSGPAGFSRIKLLSEAVRPFFPVIPVCRSFFFFFESFFHPQEFTCHRALLQYHSSSSETPVCCSRMLEAFREGI